MGSMSVVPDRSASERSGRKVGSKSLIIVGAIALGVTTMLFQVSGQTPPAPESTVTPIVTETGPLADLVPGVTGTLMAIEGWGPSQLLSWEHDGSRELVSPLPRGRVDQLAKDASGDLLAITIENADSGAGDLYVGYGSDLAETGVEVTSFAWHTTEPATMAATSMAPDATTPKLVIIKFDDDPLGVIETETVVPIDPRSVLLAWGRSGFLVRQYSDSLRSHQIELLGPSGEQLWARPAQWAYASPNGDVLISFYNNEIRELQVLPAGEPAAGGPWFELPSLGVTEIGWSSDGSRIAVATFRGGEARSDLNIYGNDGELVNSVDLNWHVWDVRWSPDDRFVMMPGSADGRSALLFFDTTTNQLTPVPFDTAIQTAILKSSRSGR